MSVGKAYSGLGIAMLMLAGAGETRADDAPPENAVSPAWNGLYGGVSGSYGFGDTTTNLNFINGGAVFNEPPESPSVFKSDRSGFLAGAQLGYDYQLDRFVLGAELDLSGGDIRSGDHMSGVDPLGPRAFSATETSVLSRLGTLRGQAGFLASDELLIYGFGGLASGRVADESGLNFSGVDGAHYNGGRAQTLTGWTAGAGAEYAITPNWGVKLEYLHYDLGTATAIGFPIQPRFFHTQSDVGIDGDLIQLGVNYHFGNFTDAEAADLGALEPVIDALRTLRYQLGTRYWYSSGTTRTRLGGVEASDGLVSRLSYTGLDANSGEIFGRADHPSGIFVKYVAGMGSAGSGELADEDFPPFTQPASRTESTQSNGALSYATADIGYTVFDQAGFRIQPFVGYSYYHEQLNAYGCTQIAGNPDICPAGSVSAGALGISQDSDWNMMRIGLGGTWTTPWHGLEVSLDGAWLPYGELDANDDHWLRIHTPGNDSLIGPILESGIARGMQLEASATLPLTDSIDAGIGARYWYFSSHGTSTFNTPFGQSVQETDFSTRRLGAFAQISAHF
jgi:opacity protein-like surface antigen